MKKIVGIMAAVAMAGSLFAVDVAADMYLEGDLATYTKASDTFTALSLKTWDANNSGNHRAITMSVSSDTVGATFGIQDAAALDLGGYSLWFAPVEGLKVTLGNVGSKSVAFPMFGDWVGIATWWPYGAQVDYTKDAFGATLILGPGAGSYVFNSAEDGYAKISKFWADARYSADFGQVQAIVSKGATVLPEMFGWGYADSGLYLGAAYAGSFDAVRVYAEAGFDMDADFNGRLVAGNLGASYTAGALKVEAQDNLYYALADNGTTFAKDDFKDGLRARVTYALGSASVWGEFRGFTMMDNTYTPCVGVDASFGGMSYGAEIDINIADGELTSVSAPFYCEVRL